MGLRKSEAFVAVIVLLSFAIGVYLYPQMPERLASHWNSAGEVDSYMPKFWGIFLMPIISAGMLLMFMLIPKIDPLKANFIKFRKYYDGFIVMIMLFMLYIYLLTLGWNLGKRFDMTRMITPAIGLLFYYVGVLMEHAKRNWFVGIRTPWTLSNDIVWDKTHKIGAKLFKISGVIALLGIILPKYSILLMAAPAIISSLYLVIYSFFEYQKQVKS